MQERNPSTTDPRREQTEIGKQGGQGQEQQQGGQTGQETTTKKRQPGQGNTQK